MNSVLCKFRKVGFIPGPQVSHSATSMPLFPHTASLQHLCPLLPGSRRPVLHLQLHPDSAPESRKLPGITAEIHPPADQPGPHLPPENRHHIPTHSNQIPLRLQSPGLCQHFPGEPICSGHPRRLRADLVLRILGKLVVDAKLLAKAQFPWSQEHTWVNRVPWTP